MWEATFPFRPTDSPIHYGWIVAAVGTLGMVASLPGQTVGVNVFSERLIEALGLSRTQVSAAYFIGTAASGFVLPFAGNLFDRYGARRMIVWASFALALSLGYMSVVDKVAGAVAGEGGPTWGLRFACLALGFLLLRFFGQGVIMMTSRNMIGKWWMAHRGKVFSIGGIAVSVCFSLAPKLFDGLIEFAGWRGAWQLMGIVLGTVFCLLAWLLYRDNPGECSLEVDAGREPDRSKEDDPEFRIVRPMARSEALKRYSFWAFSMVFALQACYFTAFAFHVLDIAKDVGETKDAMLNLFLPAAALNAVVSLFVGWAADRWRLKYLLVLMSAGNAIAGFGLAAGEGVWLQVAVVTGFGIGGGCFGALSGVFMPRFFGLDHLGAISGFFASLIVIGSSIGPLLFSVVRGTTGSYGLAHWGAGLVSLVLLAAAFWADNPQRKLARG